MRVFFRRFDYDESQFQSNLRFPILDRVKHQVWPRCYVFVDFVQIIGLFGMKLASRRPSFFKSFFFLNERTEVLGHDRKFLLKHF